MKNNFLSFLVLCTILFSCSKQSSYQGLPFENEQYKQGAQVIPGKIYCAYYDRGGEGVAYHDTDSVNHGSGELNPLNGSYLHAFRSGEGVDISYTKSTDIDNSPYNFVQPPMEMFYVGWTEPGEWTRYTVHVEESGWYEVSILYTSHDGGKISLYVNNEKLTDSLTLPTTFNPADPEGFRQWHHWNIVENLARVQLKKGTQILQLTTEETGQMNYAWLEFKKIIH
ncbi:MAG: carbohydrate-binding protein [Dysgonamonadaceae bacterium]|jgi:hypothetical protein|nr:carbohydrate-binding protein [Dysgonamonadaceae bacterium]